MLEKSFGLLFYLKQQTKLQKRTDVHLHANYRRWDI